MARTPLLLPFSFAVGWQKPFSAPRGRALEAWRGCQGGVCSAEVLPARGGCRGLGRNQVFAWWLAFCTLAAIPRDIFPIARIPRVSAQSRHGAAPRCRQVGRSAKLQGSGRAYEQGVESPRVAARLPCLALDLSKLCCNRILQPFPWALGQGAWAATGEVTQGYGRSSPVMSEGNAGPENGKGVKGLPEPREPPVLRKDGLGCFPSGSDYLPRNWVGIFGMPDSPSASPEVTGE